MASRSGEGDGEGEGDGDGRNMVSAERPAGQARAQKITGHPDELEEVKRLLKWSKEIGSVEVAREIAGIDFATPLRCDLSAGKSWGSTQEVHE